MECPLSSKNVGSLCRICLTSSLNSVHLSTAINDKIKDFKEVWPIQKMLEIVTFTKVILDDKKFPSKICQMCLSFLKIAYEFQIQFKKSQTLLEKVLNEAPTEEVCQEVKLSTPIAVELIYGENKFDLNDVLVIEEEKEPKCSFEGFLKNLGSEISARFVGDSFPTQVLHETVASVALNNNENISTNIKKRRTSPGQNFSNLDISHLRVKKYPRECKINIEEIGKNNETKKIVKTLYECPVCKKVLTCEKNLQIHREVHHPSQRYLMCEKCGHLAQTQSQLYHHMQKHKGKRFKCDHCDKQYESISRLKVHLQVHKNERPYLCNVCGKNFNYAISLTYHLRLHSDKKYVCNICGLKYRMANTLKRHLRTHTKDKPYQCSYCLKRFPSRGEKLSHEMLHTGVRPYHCEFCGKGFIKSVNLKMHYLSHPGPHQCNFCHKSFVDLKFLKIHLKRVHKDYEIAETVEN